jgi:hypothetical protein
LFLQNIFWYYSRSIINKIRINQIYLLKSYLLYNSSFK